MAKKKVKKSKPKTKPKSKPKKPKSKPKSKAKKLKARPKVKAKPKTKPKKVAKVKESKPIGLVTHFFGGIDVAIVKFKLPVKLGTTVRFKGATTDFVEKIKSMQYDHKPISVAKKGLEVGIKIDKKVREGDGVYPA